MSTAKFEDREKSMDLDKALFTDYEGRPGIRTFVDFKGDEMISQTLQDPTPIFEQNYIDRQNDQWDKLPDWKHVARIPMAQWMEWEKLGIADDPQAILKAIELEKELKTTKRRVA